MIKIEQTADGSNTLYVPELDEHYHSVKGGIDRIRAYIYTYGAES